LSRKFNSAVLLSYGNVVLFFSFLPLRAQWIEPSGKDPLIVACPNGLPSGTGIDPKDSWLKGREAASIEGDGVFGIGNFGHVPETLAWYCKSWAGGNPVAAFDIGEILRQGYAVNTAGTGGYIKTAHYMPDLAAAFYWYELAANRGYTRAMLAVAQYFGAGDTVLKGSSVKRDPAKSLRWLKQAADAGDTNALAIQGSLSAGIGTVPWAGNLGVPASTVKALAAVKKIDEQLTHFRSACTDPEEVQIMAEMLPDASGGRRVQTATIVSASPNELTCMLSLGDPPSSQRNEPVLNQFSRLIHGGAVRSWFFSIIQVPGKDDTPMILRQTATEAMIQGIEEVAVLVQTVSPANNPQTSVQGRPSPYGQQSSPANPSPRATPDSASMKPPNTMHWCAQHCTTLTLDSGPPFGTPHYGSEALGTVWIIERFTRESVVIRRTDYRPYPGTAVLTGRISSDGNSIVNGTIEWTYHPCCGLGTGQFRAAWGAALNTIPGSDAER
jgi:hypothetical protein